MVALSLSNRRFRRLPKPARGSGSSVCVSRQPTLHWPADVRLKLHGAIARREPLAVFLSAALLGDSNR